MLRLYILRHAKSSWALPGRSDFDRGLNDRGTRDLPKIARALDQHGYHPDHIYCSSAQRTRLTADGIVAAAKNLSPSIDYLDNLYSGSLDNYLNALRDHPNHQQSLMIVGHNPTCDALADFLIKDGNAKAIKTIAYKFPTGALAVFDMPAEKWGELLGDTGYLVDFLLPRDL